VKRGFVIGAVGLIALGVALARRESSSVPQGAKRKNGGLLFGPNEGAESFDFASSEIRVPVDCDGPVLLGSKFVEALLSSDFMREQIFELGNTSPEDLTFLWFESVSPQCSAVPADQWGKPLLDAYDFVLSKVSEYVEGVQG